MNKVQYSSHTASFKLKVIAYAEKRGNRAAGREFAVTESNIRYWRKQKLALAETNASRRAFRGPKRGNFPELEVKLLEYVRKLCDEEITLSHEMLRLKAQELATEQGISSVQFKASRGWVCRFLKRKGLSLQKRTSLCQRMLSEFDVKIINFHRHVIKLRKNNGYLLSQIGNANHVPLYFDMPTNTTLAEKDYKSFLIQKTGCEKLRCNVMLAITADGTKLPPYVIFKRKTMPIDNIPKGIHVRVHEKGWMDAAMLGDWMRTVWNRRPGSKLKKPSLLVWDNFRGYLGEGTKAILKAMMTDLAVIPIGLTSVLQPLDVSVNKPFKESVKKLYLQWVAEEKQTLAPTEKIKPPSSEIICLWILMAWDMVKPEVIIKSFLKTGISNKLDGSENDAFWCKGTVNEESESELDYDYSSEEEGNNL